MKIFSKCSVVFFLLMFFFGNSNSCYGMENININEQNKDISNQNKDSLLGYIFSWKCWNPKQHIINKAYELNFWAFIDILRHNCGFYLKRKKLKYGEWFLGSSIGIGWYPQFLNFHKHFRIGFFEVQYNFLSAITYFLKRILRVFVKNFFKKTALLVLFGPINFSIINFKICNGLIKIRFLDVGNIIAMFIFVNGFIYRKDKFKYRYFFINIEEEDKCKITPVYWWNILIPDVYFNLN